MKIKTFIFGVLIILVSGTILCLPEYTIPAVFFTGIFGGIYVGIVRKRPLVRCLYDGLIISIPASILFTFIAVPLVGFLHLEYRVFDEFFTLFWFLLLGLILTIGITGGPLGALMVGLYYLKLKKQDEIELYEPYMEHKVGDGAD